MFPRSLQRCAQATVSASKTLTPRSSTLAGVPVRASSLALSSVSSALAVQGAKQMATTVVKEKPKFLEQDAEFFRIYGVPRNQTEMLKDHPRTQAYQDAILKNKHLFKDKVVLDLGCGTGILSMMCASAGAKHVIAVDASDMAHYAKAFVKDNGMDNVITVLHGLVEEVQFPAGITKVDIIVSEWMGLFSVVEGMLDSLFDARDKYLAKDGILFPQRTTLYLAAANDKPLREERVEYFSNVFGYKMSAFGELGLTKGIRGQVPSDRIATKDQIVLHLDLQTATKEDVRIDTQLSLPALTPGVTQVNSLVGHFDVEFCSDVKGATKVLLETGPFQPETHWAQLSLLLRRPVPLSSTGTVQGRFEMRPDPSNRRDFLIAFTPQADATQKDDKPTTQQWLSRGTDW